MDPHHIARLITEDPDVPNQFVVHDPEATLYRLMDEYGEEWDGALYRAGPVYSDKPTHYSPTELGASNYGRAERHEMPISGGTVLLDLDDLDALNLIYGLYYGEDFAAIKDDPTFEWEDIAIALYKVLPQFKADGFDWAIITGETGANLAGPDIEVVKL